MQRAGAEVTVFEAAAEVGGLSRSLDLWGHHVELSAHIFWSVDSFVSDLWQEFVDEPVTHDLKRALFTGERTIPYPLTPLNVAKGLPPAELARALAGLLAAKVKRSPTTTANNAEAWMVSRYGQALYELLFRDYAEKLWGLPCMEIEADFPQFLFGSASATDGVEQRFVRPRTGVGSVWVSMAEHLESHGAAVHTGEPVERITLESSRVVGVATPMREVALDGIVSTMPLGRLATTLFPSDTTLCGHAQKLQARSTVLVYLLACGAPCPFNWLALYPSDFRFGRIVDFGSWQASTDDGDRDGDSDSTVYCLEAWCDEDDEMWRTGDAQLAALATEELNRTGQFGHVTVKDHHVERVAGSHPSSALGTTAAADAINAKLAQVEGIISVGRAGAHSIHGMAESMAAAKMAADLLLASGQDLTN